MTSKIILVIVIVVIGLFIVIPFILNTLVPGDLISFGPGRERGSYDPEHGRRLLLSQNGGESWEMISETEPERPRFPSRIYELKFNPRNPAIIYLGARSSGLWQSQNGGITWSKISDKSGTLPARSDVYKIKLAPSNPSVMYVSVHAAGRGKLLKSADDANSFQELYAVDAQDSDIFDIQIDPFDSQHVFIATEQGGIMETADGGRTWQVKHWFEEPVIRLALNPAFTSEIYAVLAKGKVFKTRDSGKNWSEVEISAETDAEQRFEYPPREGIFRPFPGGKQQKVSLLEIDVTNPSIIYSATEEGLLLSQNNGDSWSGIPSALSPNLLPIRSIETHPRNSDLLFVAANSQFQISSDGGASWSVKSIPENPEIIGIFPNPQDPKQIFIIAK